MRQALRFQLLFFFFSAFAFGEEIQESPLPPVLSEGSEGEAAPSGQMRFPPPFDSWTLTKEQRTGYALDLIRRQLVTGLRGAGTQLAFAVSMVPTDSQVPERNENGADSLRADAQSTEPRPQSA